LKDRIGWLKAACVASGLFIVCVLTLASSPGNTVEAERFVLKSAKGQIRAELSTLDGDYPRLTLTSPDGEKVAELGPLGVSVLDKGLPGKLPLGHFGNTGLYFTDKQGRVVIAVSGASVSGPQLTPIPEITIFNEKGEQSWRAP